MKSHTSAIYIFVFRVDMIKHGLLVLGPAGYSEAICVVWLSCNFVPGTAVQFAAFNENISVTSI